MAILTTWHSKHSMEKPFLQDILVENYIKKGFTHALIIQLLMTRHQIRMSQSRLKELLAKFNIGVRRQACTYKYMRADFFAIDTAPYFYDKVSQLRLKVGCWMFILCTVLQMIPLCWMKWNRPIRILKQSRETLFDAEQFYLQQRNFI